MVDERLLELLSYLNISKKQFADSLGISPGNISNWINKSIKSKPTADALVQIFEKFSVNLNWLLTGEGEMFVSEPVYSGPMNCSRLEVSAEISAGLPAQTYNEPLDIIYIRNNIISNINNNYYIFKVNGQSMEPEVLDGDIILVERSLCWNKTDNRTCAVQINGENTLKKVLHTKDNHIILLANNRKFKPLVVDPAHSNVVLLGFLHYIYRKV